MQPEEDKLVVDTNKGVIVDEGTYGKETYDAIQKLATEDKLENTATSIADEAVAKINAQLAQAEQQRFMATVSAYLEDGDMPHSFYVKLPRLMQSAYRKRFKGTPGHIEGRPMTSTEKQHVNAARLKKRQKNKAAKQARKRNR